MKPNYKDWKGALHAHYWDRACEQVDPEDKLAHTRALRDLIVADFGHLPTSIWPYRPERNYPDPKGSSRMVQSGEGTGDLYANQRNADLDTLRLSVFEGALAQDLVRLYSNPGDLVLDPYAGRATRLQAALDLGREYIGFDISEDALESCRAAIEERCAEHRARVYDLSCLDMAEVVKPGTVDLVVTCPPYGWSEFYGDNGAGLEATPDYHSFIEELAAGLLLSASRLKPERYLVCVVRGWYVDGHFYDVPAHLGRYFDAAGYKLASHDVHKMSTNRERFHSDVVKWRRPAQVHESVLVWQKAKVKAHPMSKMHAAPGWNTKRAQQEAELVEQRRRILADAGINHLDCLPHAPGYFYRP